MSPFPAEDRFPSHLPPPEQLLTRVVDGEERPGEWHAFSDAADRTPLLWRELAVQQRDSRLLLGALSRHVDSAGEAIDFAIRSPSDSPASRASGDDAATWRERRHGGLRFGWTGWALAACLAGAWLFSASIRLPAGGDQFGIGADSPTGGGVVRAGLSPDEALRAYLDLGRESGAVVGELPGKPVLEQRATEDGSGVEVVFIRQIIERRRVPTLYEFAQTDEFGRAVAAPVRVTRAGGAGAL